MTALLSRTIEYTLTSFKDDTKLGELANMPKGRAAIQMDLGKLEEWADTNLKARQG